MHDFCSSVVCSSRNVDLLQLTLASDLQTSVHSCLSSLCSLFLLAREEEFLMYRIGMTYEILDLCSCVVCSSRSGEIILDLCSY